jgi:hypothetical protein
MPATITKDWVEYTDYPPDLTVKGEKLTPKELIDLVQADILGAITLAKYAAKELQDSDITKHPLFKLLFTKDGLPDEEADKIREKLIRMLTLV